MNLGTIKETNDHETGVIGLRGRITTYSMDLKFRLEIVESRQKEESPTHTVIGKGAHGGAFEAGVAWAGQTKSGDKMFSLSISIPELGLNDQRYVAFEEAAGLFVITASKPLEEEKQQAA